MKKILFPILFIIALIPLTSFMKWSLGREKEVKNVEVKLVVDGVSLSNVFNVKPLTTQREVDEWAEANLKNCFHSNGVPEKVNERN